MDTDLAALFTKQEVRVETIKYLESIGCKSMVLFANWVDGTDGLNDVAVKGPLKNEHVETVRLKAVWKRCTAIQERATAREAAGKPIEDWDETLAVEVHKGILNIASRFYNWPKVDSRILPCDTLFARRRRELMAFSALTVLRCESEVTYVRTEDGHAQEATCG